MLSLILEIIISENAKSYLRNNFNYLVNFFSCKMCRQFPNPLLRSSEGRTHANHVDFEPISIETYRKISMPSISGSFGRKPLFHVIKPV